MKVYAKAVQTSMNITNKGALNKNLFDNAFRVPLETHSKNFNHERTTICVNVIVNKMPKDILFSLMDVRRSFWMVKIAAYRRSIWISMIQRNG